jgi:hypothetical protein
LKRFLPIITQPNHLQHQTETEQIILTNSGKGRVETTAFLAHTHTHTHAHSSAYLDPKETKSGDAEGDVQGLKREMRGISPSLSKDKAQANTAGNPKILSQSFMEIRKAELS